MNASAKFVTVFRIENDAFQPTPYEEIARILRTIANDVEETGIISGNIRDLNGNKVGIYSVKRG